MNILLVYVVAIIAASLLGGKLSTFMTMTHLRTQFLMSLISGFIIGMAIYHFLPHSMEYIPGPKAWEQASGWMLLGIVFMVLLLQIFNFHQHEIPHVSNKKKSSIRPTSTWGIIFGIVLHSTMEGSVLGASLLSAPGKSGAVPESLGIFLVILFHKPLDAWSIIALMKSSSSNASTHTKVNILFALVTPSAMALTYWGMGRLDHSIVTGAIGYIMAFASGSFLCIALSDLLPEIQFHRHDRGKLTLAFLGGLALSYILRILEH